MTDSEIDEAIGRIALTHDGMALYRRLVRVLMATAPVLDGGGALPAFEGRRRFAAELKVLMDRTLVKANPASDRSDPDALDYAVAEPGQPVAGGNADASRRRVAPYAAAAG